MAQETIEKTETIIGFIERIASTNTCTGKDEGLMRAVVKKMRLPVRIVCGLAYVENEPPISIHSLAKMLCKIMKS